MEKLARPPEKYNFIQQSHWDEFVQSRITEEFQEFSNKQKERALCNKYPHKTSRLGYGRLAQQIAEEMKELNESLEEIPEVDRHVIWKRARADSDGEYDPDTQLVVEKIDNLIEEAKSGKFKSIGENDILTNALGTPEHSGRVRGLGRFVTPSSYFHSPHPEVLIEREKNAKLQKRVEELEKAASLPQTPQSEVGSSKIEQKIIVDDQMDFSTPIKKEKPSLNTQTCRLAVESKGNNVASGTVVDHTSPNMLVTIDRIFRPNELLPFPIDDDNIYINDGLGQHLFWPDNLVIFSNTTVSKKLVDHHVRQKQRKCVKNPPAVDLFVTMMNVLVPIGQVLKVNYEDTVFGQPIFTYISKKDIDSVTLMGELSGNCIHMYIRFLYDKLKDEGIAESFGFISPAAMALITGAIEKRREDKARLVSNRLLKCSSKQIIFMPYNTGNHWVLVVINFGKATIYYLDPLRGEIVDEICQFVSLGMKVFHAVQENTSNNRRNIRWVVVKAPLQPSNYECGYYVMRYMKEIIADVLLLCEKFNEKETYTQEEFDEVRVEWLNYVAMYCADQVQNKNNSE